MQFSQCLQRPLASTTGNVRVLARNITVSLAQVCVASLLVAATVAFIGYEALLRDTIVFTTHPQIFGHSVHEREAVGFPALDELVKNTPSSDTRADLGAEGKICIIMSDNRPMLSLHPRMKTAEIPYYQMTMYYNLFYALSHGYCFRHISASPDTGYWWTWPKIQVMLQQLDATDHDMLVFIDSDAYPTDPRVPLSHMLNVAGFTPGHSMMMAQDPDVRNNYNTNGQLNLNTGFIVARNNNVTRSILTDILTCPERMEECEHFKRDWPHEQGAFSTYVMPTLTSQDLLKADCDLFNGYDTEPHCAGRFITHVWTRKGMLSELLLDALLKGLLRPLETALLSHHGIDSY